MRVLRRFLLPGRVLGVLSVVVGVLVLAGVGGYWGYRTWAVGNLGRMNKEPATPAPTPEPTLVGLLQANADASPPVWLRIPRVDIDSAVDEVGTEWKEAVYRWVVPDYTVGHPKDGNHPGQGSNSVMWGHLNTPVERKGDVFRRLPEVDPGDEVLVDTARFRYVYRVSQVRVVTPDKVSVTETSDDPVVTLITCVPDWVFSHRLVVTAQLVQIMPLSVAAS